MDPDLVGDLFRFVGGKSILGRLAVLGGFLTEVQLDSAIAQHRGDERPLGAFLVSLGLLSEAQRLDLERQEAEILRSDRGEPSGRAVGHYLLVEKLGDGQAGVVWKAWDTKLQRWVAVKEAREGARFARERFLREARAAAKVRHPNLIEVFEAGVHEGRDFLVMNLVDGVPLDQAGLSVDRAVAILADIADAVRALHAAGILHRDIKPQNILVDKSGRGWLADFGIARDLAAQPLTVEGTLLGTPVYMAPEQASGKPDLVREAADVYGLGATLYHLVTGRAPFFAEDDLRTLLRRLSQDTPVPPRSLKPDLPADLDFLIQRALEKDPADRYPSAAAMAEDLRRVQRGEPIAARPAGPLVRSARWTRRHPMRLVMFALVTAVIGVVIGLPIQASRRHERYLASYQEGVEHWTRGAAAEALSRFETAAEAAPDRPEPWLMKGRCLMNLKRPDEAEQAWEEALKRDPQFGPALLERTKIKVTLYLQRRLPPTARVTAGGRVQFSRPDPERPEDRERGRKCMEELSQLRNARGLDPLDVTFLEGALACGPGTYAQAMSMIGKYLAKSSWDAVAWSLHAAAAYLSGDFAQAEADLTRAIDLQPRADRYRARGAARYGLRRYAEAADDYARAGEDPAARCDRGLALQAQGKLAEAVVEYTRALELEPKFARALSNRGTAKAELLDLEGAQRDFELALETNEFYAEAYHNLGNVLLMQDRPADAIRQYELAIGCYAMYVEAYVHRARAYLMLRQFNEAVKDLQQAEAFEPGNSDVRLDLAAALKAQGSTEKAIETLKKALAEAPEAWPLRPRASKLLEEWSR